MYKGIPAVLDKDPEAKGARDAILGIANETWKLDENKMKGYFGKSRKNLINLLH